ncbi:MAG: response regulator [Abditibacteriales bacterium]|nr:response regulator [Abditibacteriales bacterium]MDW8367589.1 response regulator [Abditibacteriales bacterium]
MGVKILVVDDEVTHLHLIATILRAEGFEVLTAEDGERALDIAKRNHPDLILLDIAMPLLDGWEVLRRLRDDHSTAATPVFIVTARAQKSDIEQGRRLGVEDYITKPFDPVDLVNRVRQRLGGVRHRSQRAHLTEALV